MLSRLIVVVLAISLLPIAAAAPPASPTFLPLGANYVWAEFDLAQPHLTQLSLSAELYLYRYVVEGDTYDADDLGQAYVQTNKFAGKKSGEAFVLGIEEAVRDGMTSILGSSFPGANVGTVVAHVDRTTLVAPGGSPYDPPVKVTLTATVERTRAALGLGDLSDDAISAAFASGAAVASDFKLTADPGHHIVYTIHPPAGLRFDAASGVSSDGRALLVDVDNLGGSYAPKDTKVHIRDGAVTPPSSEDIRSSFDVTMGEIAPSAAGIPITIGVNAQIHALDVATRFPSALPAKVTLPFVNAEGMRALRATGVIKDSDIESANEALLTSLRADISRAFGPGATATGGLDTENLALPASKPYTDDPALPFLATASTTYKVEGATGDDIDLALRIGGETIVDLTLFAANGRETTYVIHPLAIAEFGPATSGVLSADMSSATFEVPAGATEYSAKLAMRGKDVPIFTKEDTSVIVTVDLKDLDTKIGGALGGDFGNLIMEITVAGDIRVIKLPDELRGSLPSSLKLDYISSDAIRLLVARGKVSDENLTKLEESLLQKMSDSLGRALGQSTPVAGGLTRATLAADLVQTPISSSKAIQFKGTAQVTKPLSGASGGAQSQAAIALYSTELPLTLPKLDGLDAVYTVIMPKGLAVTDVKTTGGTSKTGTSPDGRDQFTVTPEGGDAKVMVSMAVTPAFVLAKFWPIVLLAVILLVLIVGTPIALVVRSRGKKKAAKK